jgi:hypothetical protein
MAFWKRQALIEAPAAGGLGHPLRSLHNKSYLPREAEKLPDSLRRVVTRDRAGAT